MQESGLEAGRGKGRLGWESRMRFVHPLVVGRADEGLYRGSELDRVLGAKMQVEGSPVLEALNQLEMIGDIVPRDQDKFRYSCRDRQCAREFCGGRRCGRAARLSVNESRST